MIALVVFLAYGARTGPELDPAMATGQLLGPAPRPTTSKGVNPAAIDGGEPESDSDLHLRPSSPVSDTPKSEQDPTPSAANRQGPIEKSVTTTPPPSTTTAAPTTMRPSPSTTVAPTTTTTVPTTTTTAPTTTTSQPPSTTTSTVVPINWITSGGFEQPTVADGAFSNVNVNGWTSSEGTIEVWGTGHRDIPSFAGRQHAELNGRSSATISQQIDVVPGSTYRWSFAHRGRIDEDTVTVFIDGETQATVTSPPGAWRTVSGRFTVPAKTNSVVFGLRAVDQGSVGNLIDNVGFKLVAG
ncbi:MAG: hypothetical protein GY724_04975 [Actinomycetia bacterium]|nr:hypothetical protein [Actinomycetes bacterium]MCP5033508.1 hypothetical protein [Actinomycetes bacterium]